MERGEFFVISLPRKSQPKKIIIATTTREREKGEEKRERNVNHMAAVQHKLLLKHKHKAASFCLGNSNKFFSLSHPQRHRHHPEKAENRPNIQHSTLDHHHPIHFSVCCVFHFLNFLSARALSWYIFCVFCQPVSLLSSLEQARMRNLWTRRVTARKKVDEVVCRVWTEKNSRGW